MPCAPSELASLPLFASLPESELARVAAWFEVKEVGAGVRLAGEGTTGHSFFVICKGEAVVTMRGEEVARLGAGDFFGELALFETGRRTATVTTTEPSRILVLFGNDFDRLRSIDPAVTAEIEAAVNRRLPRR